MSFKLKKNHTNRYLHIYNVGSMFVKTKTAKNVGSHIVNSAQWFSSVKPESDRYFLLKSISPRCAAWDSFFHNTSAAVIVEWLAVRTTMRKILGSSPLNQPKFKKMKINKRTKAIAPYRGKLIIQKVFLTWNKILLSHSSAVRRDFINTRVQCIGQI